MPTQITFKEIPSHIKKALDDYTIKKTSLFFQDLGRFVDRETQLVFRGIKANGMTDQVAYNRTVWKGYSPATIHPVDKKGFPDSTRWRERKGTDGSKRMYSQKSILNFASGSFSKSWKVLAQDEKHMLYGSNYGKFGGTDLAHVLIKQRPVINYDDKMRKDFETLWRGWMSKRVSDGMKKK